MQYIFGAHQSIAGGFSEALKRVNSIGGNCLQIFSSSPRGWNFAKADSGEITKFLKLKDKLAIDPVYFHASYLVNLADNDRIGHLSKQSLIAEMNLSPKLQIKGSIVHLGSFKEKSSSQLEIPYDRGVSKKYEILIRNIKEILEKTPKNSLFIIENSGTRKIGQTMEEISQIVKDIGSPRVKLCLDTCHLFSNGYRFSNDIELESFLAKLTKLKINNIIELWHLNDSRDPFDSGRDRHENIGQGTIGMNEFKTLLNHPKTRHFPFIIETPGFANEGPDKKNLDILKKLWKKN